MNTTIKYENFNVGAKTVSELDTIATTHNGIVGRLSGDRDVFRANVTNCRIGDWKVKWVVTKSSHHGTLKLVPTNSRTKSLLVRGKSTHLATKYGLSWLASSYLVDAMMGVRHMDQPGVMELIVGAKDDDAFWDSFKGVSIDEWIQQETRAPHYINTHPIVRILKKEYLVAAVKVHSTWTALLSCVAHHSMKQPNGIGHRVS